MNTCITLAIGKFVLERNKNSKKTHSPCFALLILGTYNSQKMGRG